MMFAMSHGVNRGKIKSGKDEENFYKRIIGT